ncbi:hypothetical protein N619_31665 [Ectopseudomonas oleovorans]|nr:hypothetical protein N619_31665 [Pseudomonas oleovorans]
MSGYVPNNRNERPAPTPAPYNGDFHRQAPRPLEGGSTQTSSCLVGLRFVWDNGECLGANLPYSLSPAGGNAVRGSLDSRGGLIQTIPSGEYQAQLLADADVDTDISNARAELQAVLDEILAAERAEAARLQAIQDQRSALSNYGHRRLAAGKGFFLGAWGLLRTAKEFSDLVNPFTTFSNALRSAWQARASEGETWLAAYNRQFSAEQHREVVEALGFDPSSITREQLAEAYELACFIYEDGPSKAMLGRFAVDYAKAQNVEEIAEFSGGALFEIVLAALLIVFTGGIGLAARGAASVSYLDKLARLGNAFRRLGAARQTLNRLHDSIDPERHLRALRDELEIRDTRDTRVNLADELLRMGQAEEAATHYQMALRGIHSDAPDILLGLARARFALGDFASCQASLDQLIANNPDFRSSDGHLLYARALEGQGNDLKAEEEYRALGSYCASPEANYRYALLLQRLGRQREAIELLQQIQTHARRSARHYRVLHKEWLDLSQKALLELQRG